MKQLTTKQKKFVKAVAQHGNGGQAVLDAGYNPRSKDSAYSMANELMNKPHVADAISKELDRQCPNLDAKVGEWLVKALDTPLLGETDGFQTTMTWGEKKAFLELICKLKGYTVQRTAHVRAEVKLKKPLWPGMDK